METFSRIYERAAARKGGRSALESSLPVPASDSELRRLGDDRYLSLMARRIFQAGFVWRVVEKKWPAFEDLLFGFDPLRVAHLSDERLEQFAADRRLIRHYRKLRAIRENAAFVLEIQEKHGSFGRFVADWPSTDITGLWRVLARRGSRLGGRSAGFFLRGAGKDTFLITGDVTRALIMQKIVDREPVSQRDLRKTQAAFNAWADESDRPLCQLSRILACSLEPAA